MGGSFYLFYIKRSSEMEDKYSSVSSHSTDVNTGTSDNTYSGFRCFWETENTMLLSFGITAVTSLLFLAAAIYKVYLSDFDIFFLTYTIASICILISAIYLYFPSEYSRQGTSRMVFKGNTHYILIFFMFYVGSIVTVFSVAIITEDILLCMVLTSVKALLYMLFTIYVLTPKMASCCKKRYEPLPIDDTDSEATIVVPSATV